MNTIEAGLLLVGAGVVLNGLANYFNSRKIYLQEQQMAVGKAEVLAAIAAEREEVLEAIRAAQESGDLSDVLTAVQGIYEKNPVEVPESTDPEVVAEPVTESETGVVGGEVQEPVADGDTPPAETPVETTES